MSTTHPRYLPDTGGIVQGGSDEIETVWTAATYPGGLREYGHLPLPADPGAPGRAPSYLAYHDEEAAARSAHGQRCWQSRRAGATTPPAKKQGDPIHCPGFGPRPPHRARLYAAGRCKGCHRLARNP